MITYIACFWGSDPLRLQFLEEFELCNPWVKVLYGNEGVEEGEYIQYDLINKYLSENEVEHLCLLDTDLILGEDFREKCELSVEIYDFTHFKRVKHGERHIHSFYEHGYGGTGYMGLYSRNFLDKINNKFCTKFKYGGYDFMQALMITGRDPSRFNGAIFYEDLVLLSQQLFGITYGVLDCYIEHKYHGDFKDTKWELYY